LTAQTETTSNDKQRGHPGGAPLDFTLSRHRAQRPTAAPGRAFPGVRDEVEKRRAFRADVMDAFALLGTARRLRDGIARALPASAVYDSRGLAMQIWA